jgi:hypothetical protein
VNAHRQEMTELASQLESLAATIRKATTDGDLERCARLAATIQLTFRGETDLISRLLDECDVLVDSLLAVETAARKLREPVGYESGASSRELDEALARLDALRSGVSGATS